MDVAISIASSYQELQQANPKLSAKQLMLATMNIGKDIMGTMTNTLILAFAGSSLTTIMMVSGTLNACRSIYEYSSYCVKYHSRPSWQHWYCVNHSFHRFYCDEDLSSTKLKIEYDFANKKHQVN